VDTLGFPVVRPVVSAVAELSTVARTWVAAGVAGLAGAGAGAWVQGLTGRQLAGAVLLFNLTTALALGGALLGRLAGPASSYGQIFDRSPPPPITVRREPPRRTSIRALLAALALVALLAVAAPAGLTLTMLFLGESRDDVLGLVAVPAALVASGWTITAGLAALRVGSWLRHWERRRGAIVLCRPLLAGTLAHVYYVDASARR
jgi:hypothetical protein